MGNVDTTGTSGRSLSVAVGRAVDAVKVVVLDEVAPEVAQSPPADSATTTEVDRPSGNASSDDWHDFRVTQGYDAEALEGLGRNALRDLPDL